MKIQDIIFLVIFVALVVTSLKNPRRFVYAGLTCIILSIPLFYLWIFFTAQRLLYYGLAFLLIAVVIFLYFLIMKGYNK